MVRTLEWLAIVLLCALAGGVAIHLLLTMMSEIFVIILSLDGDEGVQ